MVASFLPSSLPAFLPWPRTGLLETREGLGKRHRGEGCGGLSVDGPGGQTLPTTCEVSRDVIVKVFLRLKHFGSKLKFPTRGTASCCAPASHMVRGATLVTAALRWGRHEVTALPLFRPLQQLNGAGLRSGARGRPKNLCGTCCRNSLQAAAEEHYRYATA